MATSFICCLNIENRSMHLDLFDFLLSGTWIMKHSVYQLYHTAITQFPPLMELYQWSFTVPGKKEEGKVVADEIKCDSSSDWMGKGREKGGVATSGGKKKSRAKWALRDFLWLTLLPSSVVWVFSRAGGTTIVKKYGLWLDFYNKI